MASAIRALQQKIIPTVRLLLSLSIEPADEVRFEIRDQRIEKRGRKDERDEVEEKKKEEE